MHILWPECLRCAADIDYARAAFMYHCMRDPAWTTDYTEEDLKDFIGQLGYGDNYES